MEQVSRRRAPEIVALVLLGLVSIAAVVVASRGSRPDEDAAMLMRYAVNFSHGHGIAYNPSGPAVDGATDLAVVPLAGGLVAAGATPAGAVAILDGVAVVATTLLLYLFGRRLGCPRWIAVVPLLVLTGGALRYEHWGYATPVFGLAVLVLWMLVERCRRVLAAHRWGLAMVAAGVAATLVRPEGLAFLVMAFVSLAISRTGSRRDLLAPVGAAAGVLALVVAARWAYFGHPLPNPYYVKGDGALYPHSLVYAVGSTIGLAWPAVAVLGLGLLTRATRRLALAQVVPLVAVTGMWLLLSNATNRGGRFQYGGSLLAYAGALVVLPHLMEAWRASPALSRAGTRRVATSMVAVVAVCGLAVQVGTLPHSLRARPATPHDGIGRALAHFSARGRVLITSEAGNIPLISGWHSVDAYGLNDAAIAHAGGLDEARVRREHPDVIVVHGDPRTTAGWGDMVGLLLDYAYSHHYRVVAPGPGLSDFMRVDQWYVFVRRDAPQASQIVAAVRASLNEDGF